jgi:hypothetical protein
MRTREEIQVDWDHDPGVARDKVTRLWLELFLDIRDLSGGVQPGPGILAELEAIRADINAALPGFGTKLDALLEESEKLVLGQSQTADMLKDCLTKIIELLEKIAGK